MKPMERFFAAAGVFVFSVLTVFYSGSRIPPHATPVKPQENNVVHARSEISLYGQTVAVAVAFPKNGGKVSGSVSGTCTGPVTGTYSGGDTGTLTATSQASCTAFFTTIAGTADFSGKANLPNHTISGEYTVHAASTTKSGELTFTAE